MGRHELAAEKQVHAPAKALWKVLTDPVRYTSWMANTTEVWQHERGRLKLGSKLRIETRLGSHLLASEVQVVRFEADRVLAWDHLVEELDGKPFDMIREGKTEVHLRPVARGTRVQAKISFVPHGLKAKIGAALFLDSKVKPQLHETLENLAKLVQAARA